MFSCTQVLPNHKSELETHLTGNEEKVKRLDELVTQLAGFKQSYSVCGQTYSRKVDVECLNVLASLGASAHKVGCSASIRHIKSSVIGFIIVNMRIPH